jgi:hypothetical protein
MRRAAIDWPDRRPFAGRAGPIRFLAVSDSRDPGLEHGDVRAMVGPIDGILGCGDLPPTWLGYLADALRVPTVYVRGNHDRGDAWTLGSPHAPAWLQTGHVAQLAGISIGGLEWPGLDDRGNRRQPERAWRPALRLAAWAVVRRFRRRGGPLLVISHAPPLGLGDAESDPYHVGFPAYRWLVDRLRPPLWLHGHTTTASVAKLVTTAGPTTLINVTGAVLVELRPSAPADQAPGQGG